MIIVIIRISNDNQLILEITMTTSRTNRMHNLQTSEQMNLLRLLVASNSKRLWPTQAEKEFTEKLSEAQNINRKA